MKIHLFVSSFALFAACSLFAHETFKQAMDSANGNLSKKMFQAAKTDADEAMKLAEPKKKADVLFLQATICEREKKFADAVAFLKQVESLPEANDGQKLNSFNRMVNLYTRNLNQVAKAAEVWRKIYDSPTLNISARSQSAMSLANLAKDKKEAVLWCQKSLDVKDPAGKQLAGNELAAALNRAGAFYLKQDEPKKAIEFYQKSLALEKTHHMHVRTALLGLTDIAIAEGDLPAAIKYLNEFESKDWKDPALLGKVAGLATAQGKIDQAMDLRKRQFVLGPFYAKTIPEAFTRDFSACASARAWQAGEKHAKELLAFLENPQKNSKVKVPALTPDLQFELNLLAAAFASKGDLKSFQAPKVDLTKVNPKMLASVYFRVSKIFAQARVNELAQHLAATEPQPVPIYEVTMVQNAPNDVSAWRSSPMVKDPAKRETRFVKYNEKAAALLINDVNVVRDSAAKYKSAETCPTSFFVSADPRGIYVYAENKDDKLDLVRAGLEYGGMLEMYLQPGFSEAYFQWMIYPATGKVDVINWMPEHPGFRSLSNYLKCTVAEYEGGLGVVMFIPWTAVYDKLPADGDEWALGVIPFMRAGGFTWGSGQVHEVHRFGRIKFKNFNQFLPQVKREIVLSAWGKYRSEVGNLKFIWGDEVRGDAEFSKILLEKLAPYDEFGKKVKSDMTDKDVDELFVNAVPVWNGLSFFIDEQRHAFLTQKLLGK